MRSYLLKRPLDLALTVLTLPLTLVMSGTVAALVAVFLGRPVLFRQPRAGRHGVPFTLLKFRTMTDARDADGHLLPDADRLPAFGRFLRSTSLDELPGLWNVLLGHMSLVGPRPLLLRYLERYSPEQARRHEVRPGITGLAQVKGRNHLSWEDKFALDVWYVDHLSPGLDARILALTLKKVLVREGVSAAGEATVTEFMGSPPTQHPATS